MVKKHREKRQRYVEHLRRVEKERDAYLAKRQGKRQREEDTDNSEQQAQGRNRPLDSDEAVTKKHRTEGAAVAKPDSAAPKDEVVAAAWQPSAPSVAPEPIEARKAKKDKKRY